MSSKYYFGNEQFIIEDYNKAKPFASFLPGIAGLKGKPMWAFFVNRGQCMSAFGIKDKDGAIMEFHPANVAYRRTAIDGFRTFIKYIDKNKDVVYEPFLVHDDNKTKQNIYLTPHELKIEEISKKHGFKIEIVYYTVGEEDFPALARKVNITNISSKKRTFEIIDGMPKLFPYGMNNWFAKHMSRTIEAWMEVEGVQSKKPFFKLRVSAADVSKIDYIKSGNFYFSITEKGERPQIIVDPEKVFGDHDSLEYPGAFGLKHYKISQDQRTKNTTPCAFSYYKSNKKHTSISSLIGFAEDKKQHEKISKKISNTFFEKKRKQNKQIIDDIAGSTSVFSENPVFDAYAKQTSLDNILRGGYPITMGDSGKVIYVYTRKHGDLERDYNNFVLNPEFYSQGNGNFRDTNQNRRNSNYINPDVKIKDIKDFYDLIQLDGANPLVVKGDVFCVSSKNKLKAIVKMFFERKDQVKVESFLKGEFTPGDLIRFLKDLHIKEDATHVIEEILKISSSHVDADHGEGYWIDHWTYNMDLVESFLSIYPDKVEGLFFGKKDMLYYDDAHRINPRSIRYVLNEKGQIRQYNSVFKDAYKQDIIDQRENQKHWVRTKNGKGQVYRSSFAVKLLVLILNKIATLDAFSTGLEMESDKPGWCDALNGLPGLLASSVGETAELLRTVDLFVKVCEISDFDQIEVPVEVFKFFEEIGKELKKNTGKCNDKTNFIYWQRSHSIKESYRQKISLGVNGKLQKITKSQLTVFLSQAKMKLVSSMEHAPVKNNVPYMYFINTPKKWTKDKKILKFTRRPLPIFLEGAVRTLKVSNKRAQKEKIYKGVKSSDLYDKPLGMYKINSSLMKESLEIGRNRVFTPGWLENESIWLHMEYKYLLELLKGGLEEAFYKEMKTALIPFQPAQRYGKSILENSSFIASSAFVNKKLHGTGFVARLSGATAEFVDMLRYMNLGREPFVFKANKIMFCPMPILSKDLFSQKTRSIDFKFLKARRTINLPKNSYAFNIFENTLIIYENPKKKDTFGKNKVVPIAYKVQDVDKKKYSIKGEALPSEIAKKLRKKQIDSIHILLG